MTLASRSVYRCYDVGKYSVSFSGENVIGRNNFSRVSILIGLSLLTFVYKTRFPSASRTRMVNNYIDI
jgi:hypothetical protein